MYAIYGLEPLPMDYFASNQTEQLYNTQQQQGFYQTTYSVLTAENGSVWFGTDRGVHQVLFRQPSAEPYIVAYGVEQGFEGLECNLNALFDDSDGCIWIGNIYGVSVFNSEAKHTHSAEVKLHFTCITTTNTVSNYYYPVLNKPAEGIILSHDNNNLIFSFKAIDMKLPSNVIYSYFMENLDAEWIKPSSTNIATYSFIPPGKYILELKQLMAKENGAKTKYQSQ